MFDWNETIPGITGSVQSRKPYPEYTKVQEVGNVAKGRYNSLAVKLTRRLHQGLSVLGRYTLSKSMDNGSGIRTLNGDTLFRKQFLLDCEWGLSVFDVRHRFVSSILSIAVRPRQAVHAKRRRRRDPGGWQISAIITASSGLPRRYTSAPTGRTAAAARTVRTPRDWTRPCRAISKPSTAGSTPMRTCCSRWAPGALPAATPLRPGYHERGCVDHPELPADAQ